MWPQHFEGQEQSPLVRRLLTDPPTPLTNHCVLSCETLVLVPENYEEAGKLVCAGGDVYADFTYS